MRREPQTSAGLGRKGFSQIAQNRKEVFADFAFFFCVRQRLFAVNF
jgi:hypothetical protein